MVATGEIDTHKRHRSLRSAIADSDLAVVEKRACDGKDTTTNDTEGGGIRAVAAVVSEILDLYCSRRRTVALPQLWAIAEWHDKKERTGDIDQAIGIRSIWPDLNILKNMRPCRCAVAG